MTKELDPMNVFLQKIEDLEKYCIEMEILLTNKLKAERGNFAALFTSAQSEVIEWFAPNYQEWRDLMYDLSWRKLRPLKTHIENQIRKNMDSKDKYKILLAKVKLIMNVFDGSASVMADHVEALIELHDKDKDKFNESCKFIQHDVDNLDEQLDHLRDVSNEIIAQVTKIWASQEAQQKEH